MMTFFIKSTVCLLVLYGFFHFFLRSYKILVFNRFYLIFSLVFSMIIALIIVPMKSNIILDSSLYRFTFNTGQFIQQGEIIKNATPLFTYQNILIALFIITSTILLIRFILNIFRIIKKIINCKFSEAPYIYKVGSI